MKNNLDELMAVLERIRTEKHPEIPADVIRNIVNIQKNEQENVAVRQGKLKNYFDQFTNEMGE